MTMQQAQYIGRFAPTPTGLLHFGSLVTAIASYCDARANQGQWLVRIEDADTLRIERGATEHILRTLEQFSLYWDGELLQQQYRQPIYAAVLAELQSKQMIYGCQCSRKQWSGFSVYPNHCRYLDLSLDDHAVRIKVESDLIGFNDLIQGHYASNLAEDVGDFVLRRKDGVFNYQLAVVVDDYLQKITHVVRGMDLLDNTPRQIFLSQSLGYSTLNYAHIPLAMNDRQQKLSKQNRAKPIDPKQASSLIKQALLALNQAEVILDHPERMLLQAVEQWQIDRVPKQAEFQTIYK